MADGKTDDGRELRAALRGADGRAQGAGNRDGGGADFREILRAQVGEHAREADGYQALGQAEAAGRLRARPRALSR